MNTFCLCKGKKNMQCRLSLPHLPLNISQHPGQVMPGSRARCQSQGVGPTSAGRQGKASPPLPTPLPHMDSGLGSLTLVSQGRGVPWDFPLRRFPGEGRGQEQESPCSKHPAPCHPRMLVPALPRTQLLLLQVLGPPTATWSPLRPPQDHTWTCGAQAGGSKLEFSACLLRIAGARNVRPRCTGSHPPFSGGY